MSASIPKTSGIYKITCSANDKIYVGSSENLKRRWDHHKRLLRNNKHSNPHLQNAWNRYGVNSFRFDIVELCAFNSLLTREQFWLDQLKPYDRTVGFNIAKSAQAPLLGMHLSESTKSKLRDANLGKKMPDSVKTQISITLKNRQFSTEHRAKLSKAASKQFIVTNPNGIEFNVVNLQQFCIENELSQSGMMHVVSGRYKHSKGWKCRYA